MKRVKSDHFLVQNYILDELMEYTTYLSAEELSENLGDPSWAIFDCRFSLQEPGQGYQEYLQAHIPGASYVNLNLELSGEVIEGKTGRHPLPDVQVFIEKLSDWGINHQTQVIAYDDRGGAIAARLWWMLRWLGHERAAVLNGGWSAWEKSGYPTEVKESSKSKGQFEPEVHPEYLVDLQFVDKIRLGPDFILIDARTPERFWGLDEPIDPIAGHIPGAISAPFSENMDQGGFFLPDDLLRERYQNLLGDYTSDKTVLYCGSGVTSIHNIIAMVRAGYEMPKLYVGSWSEWITDPTRPIGP